MIEYEEDATSFPEEAYGEKNYDGSGAAWHVLGWEVKPDEDTDWTGIKVRTGKVVAVMIGDDRRFTFEEGDLTPLAREDYCGSCGQVGCQADGYPREK